MKKFQMLMMAVTIFMASFSANAQQLTAQEFAVLSPKEAILASHAWHKKDYAMVAVTPNGVEATFNDGQKVTIPLQDEFFVSVAPYVKRTHECAYHVPTGCTGELIGKKMHLTITDKKTGDVLRDEEIKTQHDGFVDLWLPKDKEFLISFDYKGKKTSQLIPTHQGDLTCITTMQLK